MLQYACMCKQQESAAVVLCVSLYVRLFGVVSERFDTMQAESTSSFVVSRGADRWARGSATVPMGIGVGRRGETNQRQRAPIYQQQQQQIHTIMHLGKMQ